MRRRPFLLAFASMLPAGCAPWSANRDHAPRVPGVIEYGQSNAEGQAMRSASIRAAPPPW